MLALYFANRTRIFRDPLHVLHLAAERAFEDRFRRLPNLRYVSADLYPTRRHQVRADITSLQFADDSFDMIICNHVLDAVPDDRTAMTELFRVLRPSGRLITQTPIDHDQAATSDIRGDGGTRRSGRLAGANRIYGRDYPELLSAVGFGVDLVRYAEELGPAAASRYALDEVGATVRGNDIYLAAKPPS